MNEQRDALDPYRLVEALDVVYLMLPSAGGIGRRIANSRQVGRNRSIPGLDQRRKHASPQVRRGGITVERKRRGTAASPIRPKQPRDRRFRRRGAVER
jgi:hypothetical protein